MAQGGAQPVRVAILGGGPAGVGAAFALHRSGKGQAVVLERGTDVGGNAGSFALHGIPVDFGSHRLHPACAPGIFRDLSELLGPDLLDRPRHGRIRLRERWVGFPLSPLDLALHLDPGFTLGVLRDALGRLLPGRRDAPETFASILERGLGRTICRDFYFPYAVKIWGLDPEGLSAIQARRRVSAGSLGKMVGKVLGRLPGLRKPGTGRFFYPRGGFGQLSRALASAARERGARIELGATVRRVELGPPHRVTFERDGREASLMADLVWSTLPITLLSRLVSPEPVPAVLEAGQSISFRAMILVYLVLGQDRFTPFDAHYFPESHIPLTRLSEPKNYSARSEPRGVTVLCGELPCRVGDRHWESSYQELGEVVRLSLERSGLPPAEPVVEVATRRLSHAYPIYDRGYEEAFDRLDAWASGLGGLLSFGRQGLFAHDNTHHTLAMAYAAVECLGADGRFDGARWQRYREDFRTHVVED